LITAKQAHNTRMIYKFKSKAAGDLILLEPQGKQFLQIIGKPVQAQGIIESQDMLAAIAALQAAIAAQEAEQQLAKEQAKEKGSQRRCLRASVCASAASPSSTCLPVASANNSPSSGVCEWRIPTKYSRRRWC